MENYLMSSPTQLSHVYLPSENGKAAPDEQYTLSFHNGRPESADNLLSHTSGYGGLGQANLGQGSAQANGQGTLQGGIGQGNLSAHGSISGHGSIGHGSTPHGSTPGHGNTPGHGSTPAHGSIGHGNTPGNENTPGNGGMQNSLAKAHLDGRLSPSVYEDMDFASDLPDFSYDQTISLDLDEERLAPHSMIGRTSHSKTFSFDGGSLQMPFTLNSGSKFSNFSHSRNVSLDDSNYSRSDSASTTYATGYSSGHSHSVSLASNSADPPSGTFSHSMSNSTLQSVDSVPQLSSSMSNKSLQDSPYSMVNVYPSNVVSTPGRRRLSTSLSTSNLYATPLRGSTMHSPTVKVGKTPLKSHHVRSRSKPSVSIEAGSSQLLASIASMKNLSTPSMNFAPSMNLSAPNSAVVPSNMKLPNAPYNVPHSAPINHSDGSNPFESSFISPKIDMNLSDLDATPLATPAKSLSSSHMQNFTPIPHNQSFGGSLNETNLSRLSRSEMMEHGRIDSQLGRMEGMDQRIEHGRMDSQLGRMESVLGREGRAEQEYERKDRKPVDSIKIEDQDDDACKQLKRAKSYMGVHDMQKVPLSRAASAHSLKSSAYPQSASIDLLSPEIMGTDRTEFRTALKSYPASIDLAAITKSNQPPASQGYSHAAGYSDYSPEREYDPYDTKDRLLPPIVASSRARGRKSSLSGQQSSGKHLSGKHLSGQQAYPTHSQIQETSTTEEIAKFAEKIMNSDQKRPIVVQEDTDEVPDPKKKHKCPLCLARFQRPEHVKRHLKCHSSEKPFQCDIDECGRRFNRKDNLKAHLKKIHGKVV